MKWEHENSFQLIGPFFLTLGVLKTMTHEVFARQPPIQASHKSVCQPASILSKKLNLNFSCISTLTALLFFRKHFKRKHVNCNEDKEEMESLRYKGSGC